MNTCKLIVLCIYCLCFSVNASGKEQNFLTLSQKEKLALELFKQVERLDALAIDARNDTRTVSWEAFKQKIYLKILEAKDWTEFKNAIHSLHKGYINTHSFFDVSPWIKRLAQQKVYYKAQNLNIGFSWPKIGFYDLKTGQSIHLMNGEPILDSYDEFYNWSCNYTHHNACLELFINRIKSKEYSTSEDITELTLANSQVIQITFIQYTPDDDYYDDTYLSMDCHELFNGPAIKLKYSGLQSCLYASLNSYVVKIKYFGDWGNNHQDIYCLKIEREGMCQDIKMIRNVMRSNKKDNLIIDVQGNSGGAENTPWIAALTHEGFTDNLVKYKSIKELSNYKIRNQLFYGSQRAENWYKNSNKNGTYYPARADFCRASKDCKLEEIPSHPISIPYKNLAIVTNGKCASSCDDLVWRLKEHAQAKVIGQLPATDGSFARIIGFIFKNNNGEFETITTGEYDKLDVKKENILVQFQVPITKTVKASGEQLDNSDDVVDIILPIDKDNYPVINSYNVINTLILYDGY